MASIDLLVKRESESKELKSSLFTLLVRTIKVYIVFWYLCQYSSHKICLSQVSFLISEKNIYTWGQVAKFQKEAAEINAGHSVNISSCYVIQRRLTGRGCLFPTHQQTFSQLKGLVNCLKFSFNLLLWIKVLQVTIKTDIKTNTNM